MVNVEKTWVETTLETGLRRVGAPAELWDRVQFPRAERSRLRSTARWSACATLAVALIVLLWGSHVRSANVEFPSSDPVAVRAWVKAKAGIDIPLHGGRLAGASMNQGRVEIAYRAGSHNLSLRVLEAGDPRWNDSTHFSWAASGISYMLSCPEPEDLKTCALCHTGA